MSEEITKELNDEVVSELLDSNKAEAEVLIEDVDKMEAFLERLEKKLALVPAVGEYLTDIPVLISMVRSYISKEYTEIPVGTIIGVVAALLYFVSPVDAIADAIPVVGYLDDIAVIAFVIKMIHDDLEDYRTWKYKGE